MIELTSKIKAGIVGGAGYTGGEMLRILINHPNVEIVFVHSNSNAGNYVYDVHTDLFGDTALQFTDQLAYNIDVLFLCVGHGDAKKFLEANEIPEHIKVIDLSQDFRLNQNAEFKNKKFVYGLPELNREAIKTAANIANPGCFATCLQLGLLPLASKGLLNNKVHITATTGSTGAGQSLSSTSHFTWRNDNLSVYKVFNHQHLGEIGQSLRQLQAGFDKELNFVPYRGGFTRGIIASIYTESDLSEAEVLNLYKEYYAGHPFTHVTNKDIDLKQIVNTNKCFIQVKRHDNKIFIMSIMDNLLKGASGQAVQNMNIMFGLDERAGLRLKATGF
ncbi:MULTISPECIES: N-acetyl-gamma-glutamyl-phosphate reductase [unclassified Mucilaginibacter]|uniref:N-acetyl-gamma-glutamyl-phosphate reductase n=1 Tax=unclassified Mucilaginibacter TaxID=2617802 RepID=UPI002AC9515B|nr:MULTISPECIES: N-acetyl-gamma-glutamyl-phosphate reductase [unclassified Mucilaginibacter]MEB0260803.1 N-acetyl-gamma-glutamyl-phosphate reductase [Mucilaginibacter sp. 10I4]MEB0279018.1 N-acetyl-gamma-glutamyl-phosphate reductase [Mucilaginibacter sp. 10B2]MEB0299963.1 N-acetyl-gamma-glutamyl-phosphate reductase [Mucilaginibacter sp. 5C4]WPX22196.1 N-acetyl-gamma-glutamyl-phosphate reductase [Mucilaginibacter sp. 5C4]